MINHHENNDLCEICYAHEDLDKSKPSYDVYWINTHCIELRRNRESREHKNYKPTKTVF